MSNAHLAALVLAVLLLRWLAVGRVTVTVAGLPVAVPALAVAAVAVAVLAAAVAALIVYRARAERATVAAWHARKAATP